MIGNSIYMWLFCFLKSVKNIYAMILLFYQTEEILHHLERACSHHSEEILILGVAVLNSRNVANYSETEERRF